MYILDDQINAYTNMNINIAIVSSSSWIKSYTVDPDFLIWNE